MKNQSKVTNDHALVSVLSTNAEDFRQCPLVGMGGKGDHATF
jgi:hypothetical protein